MNTRISARQVNKPSATQDAGHERPYHHGSLPQALLKAAEVVLRRDGIGALTLRSIAREAGVSHTAPQHHFGDTAGVLSELAATGCLRLTSAIARSARDIRGARARRKAIARATIAFARENPDLVRLMTRGEMLDANRPSLIEARKLAGMALVGTFFDAQETPPRGKHIFAPMDATQVVTMTAAWAYVHGLAMLLIDGRLNSLAASAEGIADAEQLVEAAIESVQLKSDMNHPDPQ